MQGAEPRYELSLDEQDENNLIVTDKKTGTTVQAQQVKPRKDQTQKKWRIKTEKGDYRYFDKNSFRASTLRQKLKKIPIEETNIRNNVEASIFQLGYHYPNNKSRYRTLIQHKLWAYSRSLWINFVRIVNYCVKPNGQTQACLSYAEASNSLTLVKYITQICQRSLFGQKLPQYIANLCFNMYIIVNIFLGNKSNHIFPAKLRFSAI
jgi:hypothetical protein